MKFCFFGQKHVLRFLAENEIFVFLMKKRKFVFLIGNEILSFFIEIMSFDGKQNIAFYQKNNCVYNGKTKLLYLVY